MHGQLTTEAISLFQRDGVLLLRQVFDLEWIERLKVGLEKSMRAQGKYVWNFHDDTGDGTHFHNENRRWPDIEEYSDFVFNSPAAEICARLAGWRHANLLYESAFLRTPGTAVKTPWHQDLPYVCVEGENALVSTWAPLYPVGADSTLECVRGSHRWNKNYFRLNFDPKGAKGHMTASGDDESEWDELPDIDTDRGKYSILAEALEPGDALVVHGMVIHGSPGNQRKDRPVAAITARMLGDDAIYRPDKPGGTQPDFREEARACALLAGDPVDSELFPRVWSAMQPEL